VFNARTLPNAKKINETMHLNKLVKHLNGKSPHLKQMKKKQHKAVSMLPLNSANGKSCLFGR
jgi:hypothetical protein